MSQQTTQPSRSHTFVDIRQYFNSIQLQSFKSSTKEKNGSVLNARIILIVRPGEASTGRVIIGKWTLKGRRNFCSKIVFSVKNRFSGFCAPQQKPRLSFETRFCVLKVSLSKNIFYEGRAKRILQMRQSFCCRILSGLGGCYS